MKDISKSLCWSQRIFYYLYHMLLDKAVHRTCSIWAFAMVEMGVETAR